MGRQTRPYESLDLVVPAERIEEIMRPMQVTGYVVVTDELSTRFAMRDAD